MLFREMARLSAVPKIVDLTRVPGYTAEPEAQAGGDGSAADGHRKDGARARNGWTSRRKRPEVQVWEWQKGQRELERRLEGLKERVRVYAAT